MTRLNSNDVKKIYPRVLVISHNSFNYKNNMGITLCNLFKDWPSDCINQLYFRKESPTKGICDNYYMITDIDTIKRKDKNQIGKCFTDKNILEIQDMENDEVSKKIYDLGKKRKPFMYIVRNLLWGNNRWNSPKLQQWINDFNPEVIYFASGGYCFSCKIALEIAKNRKIPIVTHIFDDFYIRQVKSFSVFYHMNRIQYKHTFNKLMESSNRCIYICDEMKNDYEKFFGDKGDVLMTSYKNSKRIKTNSKTIRFSYVGNLGLGRGDSLVDIGRALKKVSNGKTYINVYSVETRKDILKNMTIENGIIFKGRIDKEEVEDIIQNSDILIHVESMEDKIKQNVKYSISTKIADSLNSNACILAYGPSDVASINYLEKNNAAIVISSKSKLENTLKEILESNKRDSIISNANLLANKRHNEKINKEIFRGIITKVRDGEEY